VTLLAVASSGPKLAEMQSQVPLNLGTFRTLVSFDLCSPHNLEKHSSEGLAASNRYWRDPNTRRLPSGCFSPSLVVSEAWRLKGEDDLPQWILQASEPGECGVRAMCREHAYTIKRVNHRESRLMDQFLELPCVWEVRFCSIIPPLCYQRGQRNALFLPASSLP
jgi:hypothetical protein